MSGVYISYPFCGQKCTYCNFASGVFSRELERAYADALATEIANQVWPWLPDTVYLGGGTPSRMDALDLQRILSSVPGAPWREATLEVAPGEITTKRVTDWIRAGVTRVSLGVQSFVGREVARTGRKHNAGIVFQEISVLREAGLTNLNIDLIAGLPGQTLDSWRESLAWIDRIEPPHVSVYMLEIDEDSRLGQEVLLNGKRYGAPDIPADERIVEMYETAIERLHALGIQRYEISNFARPGFESIHNLKYWLLEPYFGFGADAHSFDSRLRFQNVESPGEYVERIRKGASPRLSCAPANRAEERFFVGLRLTRGIHLERDDWRQFSAPIQRFLDDGLLRKEGERLSLTNRGVLLSNEVLREFIQ